MKVEFSKGHNKDQVKVIHMFRVSKELKMLDAKGPRHLFSMPRQKQRTSEILSLWTMSRFENKTIDDTVVR